ncbi:sensor histidine kinase KdpD [Achromobacter sp. SLBN-14]|uniref:sensor histidine kinase n=1 Tax=Achromobacter sp. SLBN-14 TaxID=2768442 RepID=UPI0011523D77|nr:HAMP domain-containing sensor histidine kinase [Achromobacter sp. SLBN-14]TQJ94688.1 signal transduction histidine kinase [Achromobacter sp. SLBN-14]
MNIPSFIREHLDDLIDDRIRYARELQPAAGNLSDDQLRNSGAEILLAIAINMERNQNEAQQLAKSFGARSEGDAGFDFISVLHADDRRAQGFGLNDVLAEFRALRASVLRRWEAVGSIDRESFQEMIRFNEAIDQALHESVQQYTKRVDRARDLFAGVLAHDLRAPMAVLQYAADILLRDATMSPTGVRATATVQRSVLRMRAMIDDLLIFTRARLGEIQATSHTSLSMHTLCSSAIEEARVLFPEAFITLNCRGNPLGMWDAGQMGQLLSNLLSNAARYGDGTINLGIEDQGDWLELTVSNGGEPLPSSALPTLFDPLTRATPYPERRTSAAGLGLGLFICKSIVSAHQGTICVESTVKQTIFTVLLPRSPQ